MDTVSFVPFTRHTRLDGHHSFSKGPAPPTPLPDSYSRRPTTRRCSDRPLAGAQADHSPALRPSAAAKEFDFAPRPTVSSPCRRLRFPAKRLHFFSWPHLLRSLPAFAACIGELFFWLASLPFRSGFGFFW